MYRTTTLDEYRHILKDGALERRFQKIIVEPTLLKKQLH
jgi:ATP-dependent Clp protease ATP-binding subunit ClpA